MVYFKRIRKSAHYIEHHEREVPWDEVVEAIFMAKAPRKNGNVFEIDNDALYIIFKVEKATLLLINAKRK